MTIGPGLGQELVLVAGDAFGSFRHAEELMATGAPITTAEASAAAVLLRLAAHRATEVARRLEGVSQRQKASNTP